MSVPPRWRGAPIIAVSSVFFAIMAAFVRLASEHVGAAQLVVLRTLIGLVGCLALFAVRRRGLNLRRWKLLTARGVFGALGVLGYFHAIEHLGSGPATVLNYCSPIYAAVFAALFLKERASRLVVVGLVLATIGAILVAVAAWADTATLQVGPAVIGLLAGVAGGASLTAMKAVREDTDAVTVFFFLCAFALVGALPMAVVDWRPLSSSVTWLVVGVGLAAFTAQLLLTYGMGHTTATAGGAAIQLTPLFSWVIGVTLLNEPASPLGVLGAVLCMAGVIVGQRATGSGPPPV